MVAIKFIVWALLNLYFLIFIAIPGILLTFILSPIYYSYGIVTEKLPEIFARVESWMED